MAKIRILVATADGIRSDKHVTELAAWKRVGTLLEDYKCIPDMSVHEVPAEALMRACASTASLHWTDQTAESLGEADPVLSRLSPR